MKENIQKADGFINENPEVLDSEHRSTKLFAQIHQLLLDDQNSALKADLFLNIEKTRETIRNIIQRTWERRNNAIPSRMEENIAASSLLEFSIALNEAVTALFKSKVFPIDRQIQRIEDANTPDTDTLAQLTQRRENIILLQAAAIQEIENWHNEQPQP